MQTAVHSVTSPMCGANMATTQEALQASEEFKHSLHKEHTNMTQFYSDFVQVVACRLSYLSSPI